MDNCYLSPFEAWTVYVYNLSIERHNFEDKIAVSCTVHVPCYHKKQHIFLPFISFPTSTHQRKFLFLSDFGQSCQTSAYLLPLKSLNIISEDFLLAFQLEPCKTILWHTFWCFSRSLTCSFYLPSDFKACNVWQPSLSQGFFCWLGEVTEIRWQMLQQHWSHIPTLKKIASVVLLIICCFMAASGTGGSLSEEGSLQSSSTE